MNFIEGLPKSGGVDTILVVVDRLTKFGHFLALKHPFTALQVVDKFVKEIVRLHGFPTYRRRCLLFKPYMGRNLHM